MVWSELQEMMEICDVCIEGYCCDILAQISQCVKALRSGSLLCLQILVGMF